MKSLTLQKIRLLRTKNDSFFKLYEKLIVQDIPVLTYEEKKFLLKLAILFLNQDDEHINKLGYRIILEYSIKFNDYEPLYEIAMSQGYIPIAKFIEEHYIDSSRFDNNFFLNWFSSFNDTFRKGNIYLSCQQKNLFEEFIKDKSNNIGVVAPTSYGKSELIIDKVLNNLDKKICILVPSKALLAQTKRRLIQHDEICHSFQKIITHPELYKGTESNVLAVLTQERLQALLNKFPMCNFDYILVDEAHNIFSDDDRAKLLSQVLLISKKRNPDIIFNYFSPFISDISNLKLKYSDIMLKSQKITEQQKIEKFYIYNEKDNDKLILFDQCLGLSFTVNENLTLSTIDFIKTYSGKKNILYINAPKSVEKFVLEFINELPEIADITNSKEYIAIKKYSHTDYNLLKCLKKGVVYHHAGMPDIIKLYVEKLFSKNYNFKYIVTTSTLLEGVNIPADRMFLLDINKGNGHLTKSQFKNLIGRVCRFGEIFNKDTGDLKLLRPDIIFIYNPIMRENTDITKYLKKVLDLKDIEDDVKNVLLENCQISAENRSELDSIIDHIENVEPNTISAPEANITRVHSVIGKLCYKHNIHDFKIKDFEPILIENYNNLNITAKIDTTSELIETIYNVFFVNVEIINENIKRFNNESARKFYVVFLNWRSQGKSFNSLISHFTTYWNMHKNTQRYIYVGKRWGKIIKPGMYGFIPLHIDLQKESQQSLINIAILRIKEEQDFVDNFLIKYIEVLNDLDLLEPRLYNSIKYGSDNPINICLLKNGFSIELTDCITQEKYLKYLSLDTENCEINHINSEIFAKMEAEEENPILIFELKYHI